MHAAAPINKTAPTLDATWSRFWRTESVKRSSADGGPSVVRNRPPIAASCLAAGALTTEPTNAAAIAATVPIE